VVFYCFGYKVRIGLMIRELVRARDTRKQAERRQVKRTGIELDGPAGGRFDAPDPKGEQFEQDLENMAALEERVAGLTPRQREVALGLASDLSQREIAEALKISRARVSQIMGEIRRNWSKSPKLAR